MTTRDRSGGSGGADPLFAPTDGGDEQSVDFAAVREATNKHARPVPDGGSPEVKAVDSVDSDTIADLIGSVFDSMSTAQVVALAVGGLILLAAISGDRGGASRRDGSKVSCPVCGERKSKRGMMGHLRWSHDLDADAMNEAKAEAGIGQ